MSEKKQSIISFCIILMLSLHVYVAFAVSDTATVHVDLSYQEYIKAVLSKNLEYQAEKYNLDIAFAEITKAKTFTDPVFDIEKSSSKDANAGDGYSLTAEISKTFELGGARRARILLAKSGSEVARASLDEFVRELVADATEDYLTAMKEESLFRVIQNSWQKMKDLADADSVRLSLGSIKYIDAAQSRIEAGVLYNEVIKKEAERRSSLVSLALRMGKSGADTAFKPSGIFEKYPKQFNPDTLQNEAVRKRPDLRLAKNNIEYYRLFLKITRRERAADVDLRLGTSRSFSAGSFSEPDVRDVYAGISIPLKFSNLNKGELKMAEYRIRQSQLTFAQLDLQVKSEIIVAYNSYLALCSQVENFNRGMLVKSEEVLQGKIYSYSRGETSLLEVLNAQRTFNDLQISYIETLYNCYIALVELEKAAGSYNLPQII